MDFFGAAFDDEDSPASFLMIVKVPGAAAEIKCCSIDLLIFDDRDLCMAACLTAAAFFGAMTLLPFVVAAAARAAWRVEAGFFCKPLDVP